MSFFIKSETDDMNDMILSQGNENTLLTARKLPSKSKIIYVFETDLRGSHRTRSAKTALRFHGAIRGRASGLQGKSYAIPVYDYDAITPLPFSSVEQFIEEFIEFVFDCIEEESDYDITEHTSFNIQPLGLGTKDENEIKKALLECPSEVCFFDSRLISMFH